MVLSEFKPLHVNGGKAVKLHRADVASRTLDPQHCHILTRQRVPVLNFRRRVAATKIGNPQIAAKQIGPVQKLPRLVE